MSKKSIIIFIVILIIVIGAGFLFARKSGYVPDNTPSNIVPPMTQNELLSYKLVNGTPKQKEEILSDISSKLDKFRVATIPEEEQTNIASITPFIPSVIEAILDGTSLPRQEDTGWGNVYHFAATIMNRFAYKIDGVQRGRDPKFSFYNSVGTADETARKSVHDNWLKWWNDNKNKLN